MKENACASVSPDAHVKMAYGPLPVLKTLSDNGSAEGDLDVLSRSERQQVLDERDDALEQLRRMEASRDELARQQGQYKGRVAKLEGAIGSSEKRLQAQAIELEACRARCAQLVAERDRLLQQVGVTPERCHIERATLHAKAKKAVKLMHEAEVRMKQLSHVVEHEAMQRQELADFALVERRALTDVESAMAAQCATLQAQLDEQGAALGVARTEAAVMQSKLEASQAEVRLLSEAHASCTEAAAKAEHELRALQQSCTQLTYDRSQAVANIRKAESEVDLIHQANEQMFRYLNYVRSRLNAHLAELQQTPDLLLLLRDLHAWCARESQGRGLVSTPLKGPAKTPGLTPAPRTLASRTPASCRRF